MAFPRPRAIISHMIYAQADLRLDTTFVDDVVVAFSFILALGTGVAARRSVNSSLDFLLSGRSLPAWVPAWRSSRPTWARSS